jgi:hypothetical protein
MQKLAQSESIELIADMKADSILTDHRLMQIDRPGKALTLHNPDISYCNLTCMVLLIARCSRCQRYGLSQPIKIELAIPYTMIFHEWYGLTTKESPAG